VNVRLAAPVSADVSRSSTTASQADRLAVDRRRVDCGGLATLVLGSRLFVTGAVDLARLFSISDAVIGLTIVAAGTSLPELASSLMAAWRKQPDIAIGTSSFEHLQHLAILGVSA